MEISVESAMRHLPCGICHAASSADPRMGIGMPTLEFLKNEASFAIFAIKKVLSNASFAIFVSKTELSNGSLSFRYLHLAIEGPSIVFVR